MSEPLPGSDVVAATAVAHVNIALIKYWGKAEENLILPRTSSLSLTLDDLYTTTTVAFTAPGGTGASKDTVMLDGAALSGSPLNRIHDFLDLVRGRAAQAGSPVGFARVETFNTVPTAAGLASSASGFAALAGAASAAAGLDLSPRELSRLARRGSGSASRSIFGGLAVWHAGHDDESSFAEPVPGDLDLAIIVLVIDAGPKAVSSREAMRRTVATSPDYNAWVERSADDLREALSAIAAGNIARLGAVSESNAWGMHAAMRSAMPPVNYLTANSITAVDAVREIREAGAPAWATMDAGPNVKVLTSATAADEVEASLRGRLTGVIPGLRTIVARSGPGLEVRSVAGAIAPMTR